MSAAGPSANEHLRKLHPASITDTRQVLALLRRVSDERVTITRGLNRALERETATLARVDEGGIVLAVHGGGFAPQSGEMLLAFELDKRPYYFASHLLTPPEISRAKELRVSCPSVLFVGERRERLRRDASGRERTGWRATVIGPAGQRWPAEIADSSPGGLGMLVPAGLAIEPGQSLQVEIDEEGGPAAQVAAEVRYRRQGTSRDEQVKIGLSVRPGGAREFVEIDTRDRRQSIRSRVQSRAGELVAGARLLAARTLGSVRRGMPEPKVVEFCDVTGERVVGLVDSTGDPRGAPAVVIPPAWGKTKETLLPLARTLVAMFEAAGNPLVVLRFDGVRRRGESHTDPWCRMPGREHHSFSISQGVRDIAAATEFLAHDSDLRASKVVLVTFSASAIEGRRAVAEDAGRRIVGWVPVVAPPDLQSAMRVVSGGLDYLAGAERGLKFGMREVLGIEIDVDRANADAIEHKLGFLEDACRDFACIDVPVSWIHGAFDGWMDLARVREVLSYGRQDNRKLLVVPTGHQLRNSRQALDVFSLVGAEIAAMVGSRANRLIPDLGDLEVRRRAERARLPERKVDLASFWHDYLLGRNGHPGMSLMTSAPSYISLMERQVDLLHLGGVGAVADLGSGLGAFTYELTRRGDNSELQVIEIDLVFDALRARAVGRDGLPKGERLSADLSALSGQAPIPLGDRTCSAVLASLLISYVAQPDRLLRDVFRVLKPGGRFVVSTLRRDADLSLIWAENEKALRASLGVDERGSKLDESLRSFFNDAARLMLLEEDGLFRFWEPQELEELVRAAGFTGVRHELALGLPPQAIIVSGTRP